jgi:amino acid transporter
LPQNQIHFVDGTMQVFRSLFVEYHLQWMLPVLAVMVVVGCAGEMINWMISPVKGLLFAAQDQFLPPFFTKVNKHGVAQNLLITQACLVSLMCMAFILMPSVNGSYWLLTDLSTQLYVMMYILLFIAAICYKYKNPNISAGFQIWGNKLGMNLICALGLIGCTVTLFVGFFPPDNINVGGALHYVVIFSLGLILMISPAIGFYVYHRKQTAQTKAVSELAL